MSDDEMISRHGYRLRRSMDENLSNIIARSGKSIASHLLSIQKHRFKEHESTPFVKELECFSYEPKSTPRPKISNSGQQLCHGYLSRHNIDARTERDYVAVSYTWNPSDREVSSSGGYMIEQGSSSQYVASPVRDCVLTRAIRYMQHTDVRFLWIDRHSVDQDDAQKKQQGVQAMHLVYSYSNHPIALLARSVYSTGELERFYRLLAGKIVRRVTTRVVKQRRVSYKLSKGATRAEALEITRLLYEMSKDDWWTRAWTFQEKYRSGVRMTLLIPHESLLEIEKQRFGVFGDLPGELCVKAVVLSDQATRLCQALKEGAIGVLTQEVKTMVNHILKTMGKYTLILGRSQLMTPKIISDISNRGIKDPWDRLAITANCCWFPNRLDTLGLKANGHSLSLSVLALFVLNGGILENGPNRSSPKEALHYTTPQYLKYQSFNRFGSPHQEHSLTFNKSCRFHDVSLVEEGIKTEGHLWKLGRLIDTSVFQNLPLLHEVKSFRLNEGHRQRLRQLEFYLNQEGMSSLALSINWLLELDSNVKEDEHWKQLPFNQQYLLQMALELAYAIKDGGQLRVGALWGPRCSPAHQSGQQAIFVWDKDSDGLLNSQRKETIPPAYAFTSIVPVGTDDADYRKDVSRHVSLEVEIGDLGGTGDDPNTPQLYIKNGLAGVCFWEETSPSDVVFPWPSEFK